MYFKLVDSLWQDMPVPICIVVLNTVRVGFVDVM